MRNFWYTAIFVSTTMIFAATACTQPSGGTEAPPEIRYIPGTYSAAADGYDAKINGGRPVTVSVSFSQSAVTAVTIDDHNESISREGVRKALREIPKAVVETQSAEVDAVGGATYTSNAIIEAVQDCITQSLLKKSPKIGIFVVY